MHNISSGIRVLTILIPLRDSLKVSDEVGPIVEGCTRAIWAIAAKETVDE